MPLGTIDRTPPPFFRQGVSALTKLASINDVVNLVESVTLS